MPTPRRASKAGSANKNPSPRKSVTTTPTTMSPKSNSSTPRRDSTPSPKKGKEKKDKHTIRLPGPGGIPASIDSPSCEKASSSFFADSDSDRDPMDQASVLDSPKAQTRSPLPPSGSNPNRSGGKNPPPLKDMYKETPTQRAIKSSLHSNRKVTLRRSYGAAKKKKTRNRRSCSSRNSGKDDEIIDAREDDGDESKRASPDLASMMSSIRNEIEGMDDYDTEEEEEMSKVSDSLGSTSDRDKRRSTRASLMKKRANHKVVAGEDFTFADILARLDDDDPDLAALVVRESGQNMKNVEIVMGGADNDEGELHETVTLVLPQHLTTTRMSDFANSMISNNSLTSLDLQGNRITDESIILVASSLGKTTSLQNLNLSHNKITSTGASSLVQLVNKSLHSLDLSYNAIGDSGIQKLAGGIANTKTLRELYLTQCKIKAYGGSFLASAFAVNKTLTSISLGNNPMGGNQSSKRLAYALMRNSRLRVLNVGGIGIGDGIEHFCRLVETSRSLKEFDLSNNQIDDTGALALGNALTVNRSIARMNLKRNKIGDLGLSTISAALVTNTFISNLDIGGNVISDEGITKLCTVLSTANNVTELDVSDNNIRIDGAFSLADLLKSNRSINVLNIIDNPIDTPGVMQLNDAIKLNTSIQACYVGVDSVGPEGLMDLCTDEDGPLYDSRLIVM